MGLTALVGGIAYLILNTGMILFATNTSMNVAHQQARMAMLQMQREMYQAVSPTQLTDEDGAPVNGDGPAAGISFHVFASGPYPVTAKANAGQNQVSMNLGTYQAKAGNRLVIANHELEIDIAQDTAGTGNQTLILTENVPHTINSQDVGDQGEMVDKPVYGIITERVGYRIKNGELVYQDPRGQLVVLAREITSDKPFSRSKKGSNSSNPRFIAAINLSTGKGKGKGPKRNRYKSSSMILDAEVPARAILCLKP